MFKPALTGEVRWGEVRRGEARRGEARRGEARQGKARQGKARQGKARQGKARQGKARQGKARWSEAMLGQARDAQSNFIVITHLNVSQWLNVNLFNHFKLFTLPLGRSIQQTPDPDPRSEPVLPEQGWPASCFPSAPLGCKEGWPGRPGWPCGQVQLPITN